MNIKKPKRLWKSLHLKDGKIVSAYDWSEWKIGVWRTVCAPTEECNGLNACENIIDAINYITPDILAEVEVSGCCIKGNDKYTCERMRVVRAWLWEKEDSVALAIFAARACLKNFEDAYPDDNRARKAIEAAEAYQNDPSEKNRSAARSAAESAARSAARSAAESAWSAAESAESAARSAARSAAESAAESAVWSAWSAARSAKEYQKRVLHDFLVERFEKKGECRP